MFRVSILPQARDDIDRNAAWWADHHSIEQALRWTNAIHDQLEMLQGSPEHHSLAAENDEFPFEIREKLIGLGSSRFKLSQFYFGRVAIESIRSRRCSRCWF